MKFAATALLILTTFAGLGALGVRNMMISVRFVVERKQALQPVPRTAGRDMELSIRSLFQTPCFGTHRLRKQQRNPNGDFVPIAFALLLFLHRIAQQPVQQKNLPAINRKHILELPEPTVQVTAFYPGANAQVVAETVAAPIEQEVNGVENMIYMSSVSSDDGSYTLTVAFEIGVDMDMATVLVQNRVAIANPKLPEDARRQGVTTKKAQINGSPAPGYSSGQATHTRRSRRIAERPVWTVNRWWTSRKT